MTVTADRVEHEMHIAAPPEIVFAFFTDPAKHVQWLGREADLDPRPGGIYRCVVNDNATVLGTYVIVDPPHHLVFTWGFDGDQALPPGTSTVSIELHPDAGGTNLRLVHTGLPHPMLTPHDHGWRGYLAQLRSATAP
ncbi:SRPBCC family protein [Kribbella sp. NPDC026596]|uniref:SRPBCC family protein n=1 Tax=Kribbella sp. NPDC026596 TaxID=3155122 RepID=UPI0033FB3F30